VNARSGTRGAGLHTQRMGGTRAAGFGCLKVQDHQATISVAASSKLEFAP